MADATLDTFQSELHADIKASILQRMPNASLRIDPELLPEFAVWLLCMSQRWHTESVQTLRGKKGLKRRQAQGRIRYAKAALNTVSQIIARLGETVSISEFAVMWDTFHSRAIPEATNPVSEETENSPLVTSQE